MEGTPAIYLGKLVSKAGFRTFIYAADGSQKLVKSWDEFEAHMGLGTWFAEKSAIPKAPEVKPVAINIADIPLERITKPKKTKVK